MAAYELAPFVIHRPSRRFLFQKLGQQVVSTQIQHFAPHKLVVQMPYLNHGSD